MNIYVFYSPQWNLDFEATPLRYSILHTPAIAWRIEKNIYDAIKTVRRIDGFEFVGEPTGAFNSGIRFVKITEYSIKQLDDGQYRLEVHYEPKKSDICLHCEPIKELYNTDIYKPELKPGQKVTIKDFRTGKTKEEIVHRADEDDDKDIFNLQAF